MIFEIAVSQILTLGKEVISEKLFEPGMKPFKNLLSLKKERKSNGISKIKIEPKENAMTKNTKNKVLKLKPIINAKEIIILIIEFLELVKTAANAIAMLKIK